MYTLLTITTPGSQYGLEVRHRAQLSASCITSNSWVSPTILDSEWAVLHGLSSLLEVWMLYPEPQNDWMRSSSCFHLFYVHILPSYWTGSYSGRTTRGTQLGNVLPSLAFLCYVGSGNWTSWYIPNHVDELHLTYTVAPSRIRPDLSCSGNKFPSAPWPWGCQNPSLLHQSLAIPHTF